MNRGLIHLLVACCASVSGTAIAADTAESLLAAYVAQAGAPASPERGQKLFTTNFGKDYNGCVDCHTASPAKDGKDLLTDKRIAPLAPAANKARFTDKHKVEMAFNMNCRDVVGRKCTAGEKADVMSWLISLKP
jgi:mono/diheme cytochrome c family protein